MTTDPEQVTVHRLSIVARGCRGNITDNESLTALITDAAKASGLSIVNKTVHAFTPHGLSIALLLAQSHLVFSTWPEYATIMLDLTVCTDSGAALAAWQKISDHLLPMTYEINEQDVALFAPKQNHARPHPHRGG
ncbi:MAG: S-adenosylmethionine decarboxylase family protein [Pseudonocardiaceae bacterium]